ncbi:MAG: glycogen synthase GlgA [Bacteroidales bacterium]
MALSILMVASEAVPFAKTGGLADVLGSLPAALAALGHEVTVVLPRYRGVPAGDLAADFDLSLGGRTLRPVFHRHNVADVSVVLVDVPALYDRDALYGVGNDDYPDNGFRFAFLSRAALEYAGRTLRRVDVVHSHDWQAGLVPAYLASFFASHPVLAGAGTVFTIHNLAYQGLFGADLVPALDLDWRFFGVEGLEYWGRISFLKAGINFSRVVTTVSPTYAQEIQTPEFGFGFDGILRRRGRDVVGILNGIDAEVWNPRADANIPAPYGPDDLSGKREAKRALLEAMALPADAEGLARPLVGLVSRMVDQKGFDLLSGSMQGLLAFDAAYVLLGSGDPAYELEWRTLAAERPDQVAVHIGFDDRLAHLIEAGSDIFLMPSRFEPCGLNQMYSLRYGTVPVVRATGGLEDTVKNYSTETGRGTGFKFKGYTGRALLRALRCALQVYHEPARWQAIQVAGMKQDHSWASSARAFEKVYGRARGAVTNR